MGDPRYRTFPVGCDPAAPAYQPMGTSFAQPPTYNRYPSHPPPFPFPDGGGGYNPYGFPPAYVNVMPPAATSTPHLPNLPPPSRPTRTLLLTSVPPDVSESDIRRELEVFGDVRAVQMGRLRDGIVTVHFYDLRHAQAAMNEIRAQHMQQQSRLRHHIEYFHNYPFAPPQPFPIPPPAPGLIRGHVVWAIYTVPSVAGVPNGLNQGTLVVFNLNPTVSNTVLRSLFEAYGSVKELRATPTKCQQKFVEFYDVRDAAKALAEMNGREIGGNTVDIEYSRPGGHVRRRCFLPAPPPPPAKQNPTNPKVEEIELEKLKISSYNRTKKSTKKGYHYDLGGGGGGGGSSSSSNSSNSVNLNLKNSNYNSSSGGSSSRPLKGRHGGKRSDPRFQINGDAISSESDCRDTRTTVMIKNIPNKYNQKLLLNMLDNHCIHCNEQITGGDGGEDQPLSGYDFVYLPIDFVNKCNVGYGFVNMTSPEAAWRLYKAFHLQNWEVFNSKKICEVTYARLQGLEALKDHFKSSKFPCDIDEYLPVVFSPARDGRQLTDPVPVAGCTEGGLTPTVSSKASEDGETSGGDFNHSCHSNSSSSGGGGVEGSQNDGGDSGV